MTSYVLDANVFIQAKNLHYGFDFCPGFWEWIKIKSDEGVLRSIEKVGDELTSYGDDLSDWAGRMGEKFFMPPSPEIFHELTNVSKWATSQNYETSASSTFMQAADCWLVAEGLATGATIVTNEKPGGGSIKKIKIPDACLGLSVKCVNPFELLRLEKMRLILGE